VKGNLVFKEKMKIYRSSFILFQNVSNSLKEEFGNPLFEVMLKVFAITCVILHLICKSKATT